MQLNVKSIVPGKFKALIMYVMSFVLTLGSVSFAAPEFFGQVAHAVDPNTPPVAFNDTYSTTKNTPLVIDEPGVLANDTDADGDEIQTLMNAVPAHGTLDNGNFVGSHGSFVYTPETAFVGTDSFSYYVDDYNDTGNMATVTINVLNSLPVALNDSYSTPQNTPLVVSEPGVLANDTDADGDEIQTLMNAVPAHGTLDNGNFVGNHGSFVYTPETDFVGTDSFSYYVDDYNDTGNMATVTINVIDNTAPTITFPANEVNPTIEATGPSTLFYFHPTVLDNVDPAPTLTSDTPAGSLFPLGPTTITWTATDALGNTSTATQTITIRDTTNPYINPLSDIVAEATSAAGAVVSFTPIASDLMGTPAVTCDPAAGSTFALGVRVVICTATDSSGNQSTRSFTVTVRDTTPPTIAPVVDIEVEASSPTGAVVTYNPTAFDLVDGAVVVICAPPSGSTFALGDTTVNCSAMDSRGNSSATSFTVEVEDTTAPTVGSTQNNDIWFNTNFNFILEDVDFSVSGMASGQWQINGGDWRNISWTVWPAGHTHAGETWGYMTISTEGENTVTVKLVDNAGNTFQNDYTVRLDKSAPIITLTKTPDSAISNNSYSVAIDFGDAVTAKQYQLDGGAWTNYTGAIIVSTDGEHTINARGTDIARNVGSATTSFTIDTVAPVITGIFTRQGAGDGYAKVGDTVRVDFTADELVTVDSMSIAGHAISSYNSLGGNNFYIYYTMQDSDIEGMMGYSLTAHDAAGNSVTVTGDGVVFDKTAPIIDATTPQTIELGSVSYDFMDGVTASDGTGTGVNGSISITSNNVDFNVLGQYDVTFQVSDNAGNVGEKTIAVNIVDTTKPIIMLTGNQIMTITVGDAFTDPGAVTDDGSEVVVSGAVNSAVAGTYTISYDATDAEGNKATTISRTVTVKAKKVVAPVADTASNANVTSESGPELLAGNDYEPIVQNDQDAPETLGAETTKDTATESQTNSDAAAAASTDNSWSILGLMWYWWLLIIAAIGSVWWFVATRRQE